MLRNAQCADESVQLCLDSVSPSVRGQIVMNTPTSCHKCRVSTDCALLRAPCSIGTITRPNRSGLTDTDLTGPSSSAPRNRRNQGNRRVCISIAITLVTLISSPSCYPNAHRSPGPRPASVSGPHHLHRTIGTTPCSKHPPTRVLSQHPYRTMPRDAAVAPTDGAGRGA